MKKTLLLSLMLVTSLFLVACEVSVNNDGSAEVSWDWVSGSAGPDGVELEAGWTTIKTDWAGGVNIDSPGADINVSGDGSVDVQTDDAGMSVDAGGNVNIDANGATISADGWGVKVDMGE